uniref:Uncharacterized protein n=1 Tax=candidate division WOR-3 bacterium TaxID=2052148 RepID=A0A7C4CD99_UNCW3
MTARPFRVLAPSLLLVLLACSVPLLERAEITPGPSIAVGAGVATGQSVSGSSELKPFGLPILDYCVCPVGMLRLSAGTSPGFGLFLQGMAGPGFWTSEPDSGAPTPLLYDCRAGIKFRAGQDGAVRAGLGLPGLLDIEYLHDLNRWLTASAGLGLRGVSLGLGGRIPLSNSVSLVAAGSAAASWEFLSDSPRFVPATTLGMAVEAARPR